MSFNQALQMIERNGGSVDNQNVTIKCQQPIAVRYEKAFEGMYPISKIDIGKTIDKVKSIDFEGTGAVFKGSVSAADHQYVGVVEMYVNGQFMEKANLPASYTTRRHELFWKYQLPKGKHTVTFKWLNPQKDVSIHCSEVVVYSDGPRDVVHQLSSK